MTVLQAGQNGVLGDVLQSDWLSYRLSWLLPSWLFDWLLDWHSLCRLHESQSGNEVSSSESRYLLRYTIREIRRPTTRKYVSLHVNIFSKFDRVEIIPKAYPSLLTGCKPLLLLAYT